MNLPLLLLLALLPLEAFGSANKIRRVSVRPDEIVNVKTALGIASIIQVPDSPNNLVLGDKEAFKVEYLDRAITIKPLGPQAKSNLYVYTSYDRYNVELTTVPQAAADYVVYLSPLKEAKTSTLRWMAWSRSTRMSSLSLSVNRLGRAPGQYLIIEFQLDSKLKTKIDPGWIWITQAGETRPIHSLSLSDVSTRPGRPVKGIVQLLMGDIRPDLPLTLELRRMKQAKSIVLPEALKWK